tara:strand:- start:1040 stop:1537 length:498 start_codon:yes stop_codon:yes gene_type:complete
MGCGKTSIAKYIANKLSLDWIDLDQIIEENENMKISKIFKLKGELEFRKIENKILIKVLNYSIKSVISVGGGTPCYFENMNLIKTNSRNVFYINTSIKILSKRLYKDREHRPIISQFNSLDIIKEFVSKHVFERIHFYNMANYKINALEKGVKEIGQDIIEIINQ